MPHLYELIQHNVTIWQEDGYPPDAVKIIDMLGEEVLVTAEV